LLLDRKRIRKWARWVALILAIIFCVGAVGIGVGSGVGGMNVLDAFSCGNPKTTDTSLTQEARIAALLAKVATDPKNVTNLQALATAYEQNNDFTNAAKYLEQVIVVDPTQEATYFRLATLYKDSLSDYGKRVAVLNKAQAKFPNDANVYLQLGLAQRDAGNTSAAILAWQKYLQLAPNGDQAASIKDQLATMAASATTTTTTAGSSSTTSATTATTAGSTSTTAGPTTTVSTP
jgi:cytochrome c-type biogenesis protein CcmH/NrfG